MMATPIVSLRILILSPVVFAFLAFAMAEVQAITQEECETKHLPELLECMDTSSGANCGYLPVLDASLDANPRNDIGYWMQNIRDTATTQVFVVGNERFHNMIVIDTPLSAPDQGARTRRRRGLKKNKRNRKTGSKLSDDDRDLVFPKDITVAFIDLPDSHIQLNPETRQPIGHHSISALHEIMNKKLNRPFDDIAKIEIIYSHQHQDHIGGTNITYSMLTNRNVMGFDPSDISIIGTQGTANFIEELKDAGVFTYRAMPPTMVYDEEIMHRIGLNTHILMTPIQEAHTSAGSDVIFYMERDVEYDQPPILMMVDIV